MSRHRFTTGCWLPACAAIVFAATLGAQSLDKLPDSLSIKKSADSPGQVVFNHATHVDSDKPDCTGCHPKPFRILKSSEASEPAITHARMEKGELCGACHNGKKAFALDEDCAFCHHAE